MQQAALEQGLCIAPPVGNQININGFADHPINQTIGFEKYLAVFADAEMRQLFGKRATFRKIRQAFENFFDAMENIVDLGRVVMR